MAPPFCGDEPAQHWLHQELRDTEQVEIQKVASVENIADVLTKALPAPQYRKLMAAARMKVLDELSSK